MAIDIDKGIRTSGLTWYPDTPVKKIDLQLVEELVRCGYVKGDKNVCEFRMDIREAAIRWGSTEANERVERVNRIVQGFLRLGWELEHLKIGYDMHIVFRNVSTELYGRSRATSLSIFSTIRSMTDRRLVKKVLKALKHGHIARDDSA